MAKYLKKPVKKRKRWGLRLAVGMILYAVVFLALTAYGLKEFWKFIDAYEQSRNSIAIDGYMEKVTEDYLCDQAAELIATIDHNIQSEEECREVVRNTVAEGVRYARKSAECTDTREVYVLRSGKQVVGQFVIEAQAADEYGFTPWKVTEESFDFSFLVGEPVSISAPENFPVYVNGTQLDSSYVTASGMEFTDLEEFYEDFDLPTIVTYEAGPFLGNFPMEVTDPDGNPVTIDESTDMNGFLDNCTEEEEESLRLFMEDYIERYVGFAGLANGTLMDNYRNLLEVIVEDSVLASRLHESLQGQAYAHSQKDDVMSIEYHHIIRIEEGRYICDVTYLVDTINQHGNIQTTNNIKVVVVQTDDGLKVETMTAY